MLKENQDVRNDRFKNIPHNERGMWTRAAEKIRTEFPRTLERGVQRLVESDKFDDILAQTLIELARANGREDLVEKIWARELKELEKEIEKGGDGEVCCSWAAELAYNIGDMKKHREYLRRGDEYIIEDHIDFFVKHVGDEKKAKEIVRTLIDWGTTYEIEYMVSNYGFTVDEMMAKTPDEIREEFEFYYNVEMEELIAKDREKTNGVVS